MRPELPGFYYDEEKKKYFSIKGPIPGSKSSSSSIKTKQAPDTKPVQEPNYQKRKKLKAFKLLCSRELSGSVVTVNKKRSNFKDEIEKTQASNPVVWRYDTTGNTGDAALKQFQVDIQTPQGLKRKNILVAGSTGGCLSILRVSGSGQVPFDESEAQDSNGGTTECEPVCVFPRKEKEAPRLLWRPARSNLHALSSISSIQLIGRSDASEDSLDVKRALITTMGSAGGGSVFILNLAEEPYIVSPRSLQGNVSSECTIWTADCNVSGSRAAIGTNLGAGLVDLETGAGSYFLRSESDVLAVQFQQSGNIVHCGLRNGAIVSVDLRVRPGNLLTRHRIRSPSSSSSKIRSKKTTEKEWLRLRGNLNPSHVIYMPSSLTCLKTLKTYDQYLMASSMYGTIKLYDQRMVKRGVAVQTYEGHVNSHTRIEFGIDPSERFLMSGGDDCYTRIWSIKSGQLLSENKFSDTVPSVVCWSGTEGQRDMKDGIVHGAWLGSREAIFRMF